jgi:hypothetical protein
VAGDGGVSREGLGRGGRQRGEMSTTKPIPLKEAGGETQG